MRRYGKYLLLIILTTVSLSFGFEEDTKLILKQREESIPVLHAQLLSNPYKFLSKIITKRDQYTFSFCLEKLESAPRFWGALHKEQIELLQAQIKDEQLKATNELTTYSTRDKIISMLLAVGIISAPPLTYCLTKTQMNRQITPLSYVLAPLTAATIFAELFLFPMSIAMLLVKLTKIEPRMDLNSLQAMTARLQRHYELF